MLLQQTSTAAQASGAGPGGAAGPGIRQWIKRARRPGVRWGTFAAGAILLSLGAMLALTNFGTRQDQHLRVFGSFWASGWGVSHGLNPYTSYPRSYRFEDNLYQLHTQTSLNLSPPPLLPLFQVTALFNAYDCVQVWTLLSLLLFLAGIALLMVEYGASVQRRQILWYFLGPTAFTTLLVGQTYALVTLFAILGWIFFEHKRYVAAGIFLALVVVCKPNLGLWPIFLAICGYTRVAKSCAVAALALCLVPALLYGPQVYVEWLRVVSHDPHWVFFTDVSLTGFAARLGHKAVGQALSMVLLAATIVYVVWKRPSAATASGIALCVGLLASPLAWIGYSLFLTPILLRRPWSTRLSLALAPLMLPAQVLMMCVHTSRVAGDIAGLFYLVPLCILLAHFMRMAASESGGARQLAGRTLAPAI